MESTPTAPARRGQPAGLPPQGVWARALTEIFGLDLRSLALFRIMVGIVVLVDLAVRVGDLYAHYSDRGVFSRDVVIDEYSRPLWFSVHLAVGAWPAVLVIFLIHSLVACFLVLGLRTRLMTVLCWFLVVSLQNRNPAILNAADTLLRLLLFWGMFLPLGARCSLDSRRTSDPSPLDKPYVSMASVGLIVQIVAVYFFGVMLKSSPRWWNGEALHYALHVDLFATRLGVWLREQKALLPVLTYLTIYWELCGPLLLFVPVATSLLRGIILLGFVLFHAAVGLTMNVGIFPIVAIAAWTVLTPRTFWTRLGRYWPQARARFAGRLRPLAENLARRLGARTARLRLSLGAGIGLGFVLCYILAWNLRTLDFDRYEHYVPRESNWVGNLLRLEQKWNMFAPAPPTNDGWYVIPATLLNSEEIDLFRDGDPVSWEKPPFVLDTIPNRRWGKLLMRMRRKKYRSYRRHYARYLTREWNRTHDYEHQLKDFRIVYMREDTNFDGPARPRKIVLWVHTKITPRKKPQ